MALTSDQFRAAFQAADHLLNIRRADGSPAIAVGLNGDRAVLHGGAEIPLDHLLDTGLGVFEVIPPAGTCPAQSNTLGR